MHCLTLMAAGLSMLCAGCAIAPAREPVVPESALVLQSADQHAECRTLWRDVPYSPPPKFDPVPYGWVHARYDVEHGTVVNVEVLDSSPKKLFDADIIALIKNTRFAAQASAHGCVWNHKWD